MLLAGLEYPAEELAFGHTKIFIRSPRTVSLGMGEFQKGSKFVLRVSWGCSLPAMVVPSSSTWSGGARSAWPSSPPSSRRCFGAGGAGPSTS